MKIAGKLNEREPGKIRPLPESIEIRIVLNGEQLHETNPMLGKFQTNSDVAFKDIIKMMEEKWKQFHNDLYILRRSVYLYNGDTGVYEMIGARVRMDKTIDDYEIFDEVVYLFVFTYVRMVDIRMYIESNALPSPHVNPFRMHFVSDVDEDASRPLVPRSTSLFASVVDTKGFGIIYGEKFFSMDRSFKQLDETEQKSFLRESFPDTSVLFRGPPLPISDESIYEVIVTMLSADNYVDMSYLMLHSGAAKVFAEELDLDDLIPLLNANRDENLFSDEGWSLRFIKRLMNMDDSDLVESNLQILAPQKVKEYVASRTGSFLHWFGDDFDLFEKPVTFVREYVKNSSSWVKVHALTQKFGEEIIFQHIQAVYRVFLENVIWEFSKRTTEKSFLRLIMDLFPKTYNEILAQRVGGMRVMMMPLEYGSRYNVFVDGYLDQMMERARPALDKFVADKKERKGKELDVYNRLQVLFLVDDSTDLNEQTVEKMIVDALFEIEDADKLIPIAMRRLPNEALNYQSIDGKPLFFGLRTVPENAKFGMIDSNLLPQEISRISHSGRKPEEYRDQIRLYSLMHTLNFPVKVPYMLGFFPEHIIPKFRRTWFESTVEPDDDYNPDHQTMKDIILKHTQDTPLAVAVRKRPQIMVDFLDSLSKEDFDLVRDHVPLNYAQPFHFPLWTELKTEHFEVTEADIYYSRQNSFERYMKQWLGSGEIPLHAQMNRQKVDRMRVTAPDIFRNVMMGRYNFIQFVHLHRGCFFYVEKTPSEVRDLCFVYDMYGQKVGSITDARLYDPEYSYAGGRSRVDIPRDMLQLLNDKINF